MKVAVNSAPKSMGTPPPGLGNHEPTPGAKKIEARPVSKSTWQQAIDEGAIPLDDFIAELRRQINEDYDKLKNA